MFFLFNNYAFLILITFSFILFLIICFSLMDINFLTIDILKILKVTMKK